MRCDAMMRNEASKKRDGTMRNSWMPSREMRNFFLLSDAAAEGGRGESTKPSPSCLMMFIIVSQRHAIFAFLAQNIKFIMMIRDWNPRMLPVGGGW
jgi:hypothetical protein